VIDEDHDDEEDTGPVRLWPALVALAAAAILAVVTVVVVVSDGELQPEPEGESVMRIVDVVPGSAGLVRLVLEERGCDLPTRATADLRADAIAFTVHGRARGAGCTMEIKHFCAEVQLSQSVGPRRVLPGPVAGLREQAEAVIAGGCAQIPVEEG